MLNKQNYYLINGPWPYIVEDVANSKYRKAAIILTDEELIIYINSFWTDH